MTQVSGLILGSDGKPVSVGTTVSASDTPRARLVRTKSGGRFTIDVTTEGPALGLFVDKRPVLAFPRKVTAKTIDVGTLQLLESPQPFHAFHAPQGNIFGAPVEFVSLMAQAAAPAARSAESAGAVAFNPSPAKPGPRFNFEGAVPFATIFDSTSHQIARSIAAGKGSVQVTGASITIRGVPKGAGEDLGFILPNEELIRTGAALSEVSFALKPGATIIANPIIVPTGPAAPNIVGYTRELATRKLEAQHLSATFVSEVVRDAKLVGRVVRQNPPAGRALGATKSIQLFLGQGTS